MFQLGFGLISDNSEPSWWMNILRTIFSTVDMVVYTLISWIYQILFQITDADIITPDIVNDIYGRIQLILGVVMIFKLATSILQVIINPDLLNDQKRGTGKIISRILIMLVLFVSIIPLNIPGDLEERSYNEYISNNGLLFGTLYSLQHRIMSNNTLERFVFGTKQKNDGTVKINDKKTGSRMAAYILRGFVRPNLKSESKSNELNNPNNYVCKPDDTVTTSSNRAINTASTVAGGLVGAYAGGKVGAMIGTGILPGVGTAVGAAIGAGVATGGAWVIGSIKSLINKETMTSAYVIYASTNSTAGNILDILNVECKSGYAFTYLPIISSICGIIILLALIGSCIDIAIRTIKLAVLRLIAPIPIISYIDPKSSENGTFANWVKMLTTTYLDLFIRVLVIYFVIYIVTAIINGNIDLGFADGPFGIMATIFVIIGLFLFIKQAPKFIRDALGLKGMMSNVGLSGVLGGTSALIGGAGLKGAAAASLSSMQTSNMAAAEGKQAPSGWGVGRDLAAQIKTGDPKAKGGVINAINDRLMRDAGVNIARKRYGVTAQGLDLAKQKMFQDENELNRSQDRYDRFVRGQMDATERTDLIRDYGSVENARAALMKTVEDNKKKYGMSKTNYEEAKKFGDSHRVTPSFEEEHRASLRERRYRSRANRLADRPDMFNSRGEGATAHQRGMDRIVGSRDEWSDINSPRVDNRWSPGSTRNSNENAIHDNPDRNIDTPQAGPPPGGPHP